MTTWDLEPDLEWRDWTPDQGPAPARPDVLDTPEDEGERMRGGWSWSREYVANRMHWCSLCPEAIGKGDRYLREAVLLSPYGTCAGRVVIVTRLCCSCRPYPE